MTASTDTRHFPCEGCGADLVFGIGVQALKCSHCGFEKAITVSGEVVERDFMSGLQKQRQMRNSESQSGSSAEEVECAGCGSKLLFEDGKISSSCGYCGAPLQNAKATDGSDRLAIDGVLPFGIDREHARKNLREWVASRWFAPSEFKSRGVQGRFEGMYCPFWTFDAMTASFYRGERGEDYTVEVGSGDDRRTETRTRWYRVDGNFQRFFDDVIVPGIRDEFLELMRKIEPWPFTDLQPYDGALLAGKQAKAYDVDLEPAFGDAQRQIDDSIRDEVRRRIGGDRQRVHSVDTSYDAVTYKYVLLPTWSLAYRYNEKTYRVLVNGATGEVQGERPWSIAKIAAAVLSAAAVIGGALYASGAL